MAKSTPVPEKYPEGAITEAVVAELTSPAEIAKQLEYLRRPEYAEEQRLAKIAELEKRAQEIRDLNAEEELQRKIDELIVERDAVWAECENSMDLVTVQAQLLAMRKVYENTRRTHLGRAFSLDAQIESLRRKTKEGDGRRLTSPVRHYPNRFIDFVRGVLHPIVSIGGSLTSNPPPDVRQRQQREELGAVELGDIPPDLLGNPLWSDSPNKDKTIARVLYDYQLQLTRLSTFATKKDATVERALQIVKRQQQALEEHPEVAGFVIGCREVCMHAALGRQVDLPPSVDLEILQRIMGTRE